MSRFNSNASTRKKSLGQGMTEYIIIVGVIAVAAIGTFGYFGDVLEHQTAGMAAELSGGDGGVEKGLAGDAAGEASDIAANHNDLSNYDDNGQAGGGAAE